MIKLSLAEMPGSSGPSTLQRKWTPVETMQPQIVSQQSINTKEKTVDCCVAQPQEDCRVVGEVSEDCMDHDDVNCLNLFDVFALEQIVFNVPTPKTVKPLKEDLVPAILLCIKTIQSHPSFRILSSLLDSGSRATLINENCLPRGATPVTIEDSVTMKTLMGTFNVNRVVALENICVPEMDKNKTIVKQMAYIFKGECAYDVILGRDFLKNAEMILDFKNCVIEWLDCRLPMVTHKDRLDAGLQAIEDALLIQEDEEMEIDMLSDLYVTALKERKYDAVNTDEMCQQLQYLTHQERNELAAVLHQHAKLFSGKLGRYPHKKVHLEVDPTAKPVHARAFPVPKLHEQTFKNELQNLCFDGVLSPIGGSEWASPTFLIAKKDGRVRWVSDFRALNKVLKRKQYPLPIITDIIRRRTGYSFFSKLDISMQYYTFELDDESKDLCAIITPFGKFKYNRLPMGVKIAPDFAQEVMEDLLCGIEGTEVYIDDIGAFSSDWRSHLQLLDRVLTTLEENGFTVNPLKCEWAVKETDWLGYWLTPNGLKPWNKKIQGILDMEPPKNLKQLRAFLGMVNYYRDMWPRRAHILKPLTDKSGTLQFLWTDEMNQSFLQMKALLATDTLLYYPNHNLPFQLYTNASDYQLGAIIMQNDHPVAYYSKKLTPAQANYTTMEKELLSIVMVCKEFRSILLGSKLFIYTDHKNLTFKNLNSQTSYSMEMFH